MCRDCGGRTSSCEIIACCGATQRLQYWKVMVLHLIKLAVGVADLAHMKKLQPAAGSSGRQPPRSPHWSIPGTRRAARRSCCRRSLILGGAWRHPLPPGAGRLRRGSEEEAHKYCKDQGQSGRSSDRAARLPGLPGLALLQAEDPARPSKGDTGDMPGNGQRAEEARPALMPASCLGRRGGRHEHQAAN